MCMCMCELLYIWYTVYIRYTGCVYVRMYQLLYIRYTGCVYVRMCMNYCTSGTLGVYMYVCMNYCTSGTLGVYMHMYTYMYNRLWVHYPSMYVRVLDIVNRLETSICDELSIVVCVRGTTVDIGSCVLHKR